MQKCKESMDDSGYLWFASHRALEKSVECRSYNSISRFSFRLTTVSGGRNVSLSAPPTSGLTSSRNATVCDGRASIGGNLASRQPAFSPTDAFNGQATDRSVWGRSRRHNCPQGNFRRRRKRLKRWATTLSCLGIVLCVDVRRRRRRRSRVAGSRTDRRFSRRRTRREKEKERRIRGRV